MRPLNQHEAPKNIVQTRRRMVLRRVFVALLLLLLVDTIAWTILCRQLQKGVRDAAAAQDGWVLAAERMQWSGWPIVAAIDLGAVSAAGNILPDFLWQAEHARVELAFLHPTILSIRVTGAQSLRAQGVPAIPLAAARTVLQADLTGVAPLHAGILALTATLPAGNITLDRAELTLPPDGVSAELSGLSLPGVATAIGTIRLRASIDPALPLAETAQAGARAWRQAAGHIEIAEAALHWDTLDAVGSGKITLDDQLQPRADGTVQASGLPRLLDDLARLGVLAPAQAGAAKAVIAILAAPSGGERVQLPLSLEAGVLRLARFPLLRFQPLVWD